LTKDGLGNTNIPIVDNVVLLIFLKQSPDSF